MDKLKGALAALKAKAVQVWEREPLLVLSAGTSGLIGVAAAFGLSVSKDTAGLVVELAIPLLLGVGGRHFVTPAK